MNKPYPEDVKLLRSLGLKEWEAGHMVKTYIGKVTLPEDGWVKIWVHCLPAQFYEFEIKVSNSGELLRFSTGSGMLSTYWPMAKAVAENMFAPDNKKDDDLQNKHVGLEQLVDKHYNALFEELVKNNYADDCQEILVEIQVASEGKTVRRSWNDREQMLSDRE